MGWWILGGIALVALQFFALALVTHFDDDCNGSGHPPKPLQAPSNVSRVPAEKTR